MYRIALSKFLLLARHAGRGARMPELCLRLCRDGEHLRSGSPGRDHHLDTTRRVPLWTLVEAPGGIPFQYQNTVESAYRLLPHPPQTPAARFKRLYRK